MLRALLIPVLAAILPVTARAACDVPVCLADPDSITLGRVITFDDQPSGWAIGTRIDTVLVQPGASFGERFAGQSRSEDADHDVIGGTALAPLTVVDGGAGQTLGIMRLNGTNLLLGHGPRGYPRAEAVGEGAIAVVFDTDQPAFGFDLRGGEAGFADIAVFDRQGRVIARLRLGPVSEQVYVLTRRDMQPDIAGFVLTNSDPEGVALDNLRFADGLPLG